MPVACTTLPPPYFLGTASAINTWLGGDLWSTTYRFNAAGAAVSFPLWTMASPVEFVAFNLGTWGQDVVVRIAASAPGIGCQYDRGLILSVCARSLSHRFGPGFVLPRHSQVIVYIANGGVAPDVYASLVYRVKSNG